MLQTSHERASGKRPPIHPSLSLTAGQVMSGRYRIDALIRAEGSSVHLRGVDVAKGHPVIVELMIAWGDPSGELRDRFLAAARKATMIAGSHVARVLDAGITLDGHPFAVREAIPATTLAAILEERSSVSTAHAIDLALDVCDALNAAHEVGIFHGALGPSSVHVRWTIDGPRDVKVTGIAAPQASVAATDVLLLRAPEMLGVGSNDVEPDARTDVWSIGALLYRMLSGASPFAADSLSGLSLSVKTEDHASLAGVPDELADIVDACLEKDPLRRPASALALARKLARFSSQPVEEVARFPPLGFVPQEIPSVESLPLLVVDQDFCEAIAREPSRPRASSGIPVEIASLEALPELESIPESAQAAVVMQRRYVTPSPPPPPVSPWPTATQAPAPPFVTELAPPPPSPLTRMPRGLLAGAAAFLLVGIVTGAAISRRTSEPAAQAPSQTTVTAATQAAATQAAPTQVAQPAPAPAPAPSPVVEPAPVAVAAAPATPAAPAPVVKPSRRSSEAPRAAAPKADPVVRAASAPVASNPQSKASGDDDLRRFLDDRR